jgi:hypothetical protein
MFTVKLEEIKQRIYVKFYWSEDIVAEVGSSDLLNVNVQLLVTRISTGVKIQGGSNMTGTNCDLFTHK